MMHATRTAAQAKEWIESQGKSITDLAETGTDLFPWRGFWITT